MATVGVIFVSEPNRIAGRIVQIATHSEWSHVGIFMLGGIVEAIMPAVQVSPEDKYAGYKTEIVEVDIPDLMAAMKEAERLEGTPYGLLTDCFDGGLHDVTGINLPGNGEKTVDCSETVTRILRAGGLGVLPGVPPDCVTPKDLYGVLKGA